MKAGKYNIKELFTNKNIEAITVPEIQRDYVWTQTQVEGLLKSIIDDYSIFENNKNELIVTIDSDKSFEKTLLDYYNSIKYSSNIGFIYAYSDREYPDKYFLIDGQQRLTTIYLILAVLASKDKEFNEIFRKSFFNNEKSFIEYRVREASLLFLNHTISHITQNKDIELKDQYWYYNFYENDKTIQSIINNILVISNYIDINIDEIKPFKDYVLSNVQFWYFDTNISEQGEELYIYMNARGENMQSNENLKADLLMNIETLDEKNQWGEKWELWQNLFWLIRGDHENADIVFNEFIYCIAGMENSINKIGIQKEPKDKKFELPTHNELLACFQENGLCKIESYINAITLLNSGKIEGHCNQKNIYLNWIFQLKNEIIQLLNNDNTNWFANVKDKNRNTERNKMVLAWSVLKVLESYNHKSIDDNLIFCLRIFYNRYHNFNRGVIKNIEDAILFSNNGFENILKQTFKQDDEIDDEEKENEEFLKYNYITNIRKDFEKNNFYAIISEIWKLEDHPTNLDGRYVGNTNSSHLIDYEEQPDYDEITLIKNKFYELIPLDNYGKEIWDNYGILLNCLISYGTFWNSRVTNDYDNLDFNNEKRIIRDVDSREDKCFKRFFQTYVQTKNLKTLADTIITETPYNYNTESWLEVIQWYNHHLKEKLWDQGYYIAVGNHNYNKIDKYFTNFQQFVNTKGDFKGGSPQILSKLVKIKTK
ncbi:DUF262 domain-containing protein [Chryseobacterium sp. YR221]|uniref:DUF262 domain-containing protein n=1 Tax=Chryseobacterium sp. YR221 TaxID=1500293 RepID=UPI0009D913DE|nr:DUF262 domain-containing protein [Chryseobacterium sp. YR221]SMC95721.1 Protein of unknown function DUF262 [Chryseobacterium sp. YR221]